MRPTNELTAQDAQERLFSPLTLRGLTLRNRTLKTATYEGMAPQGIPSDALLEHHRAIAAGGIGMTTLAYCSVSPDGRTFSEQMFMQPAIHAPLQRIVETIHKEGAAAMLQLGHCGYFTKNEQLSTRRPLAPSRLFNPYGLMKGLVFSREMNQDDLERTAADFAYAAQSAKALGFDAIELHLGHGYLLSQFLSPWSNRRKDAYGGDIHGRLRFPLEVIQRTRDAVGADFPIFCKINLSDGFAGGSTVEDAIQIAQALEAASVDALVLSGGFVSRSAFFLMRGGRPLQGMIQNEPNALQRLAMRLFGRFLVKAYPFQEMFFLEDARRIRAAVKMPLVLLGGLVSLDNLQCAMQEGFEMVALGRALLHDPAFLQKIQRQELQQSPCNHCNLCVVEMDRQGVRCALV
jgi:2,4-dienoyl-CoA reductase-like NADH-dependent reductase (Old Yellow Enzyme family)